MQNNDCAGPEDCMHHVFLGQLVHADLGAEWLIDGLIGLIGFDLSLLVGLIDMLLQNNDCTGH